MPSRHQQQLLPSWAFEELDHLEPWIAHQHPERPFDLATWLCDCRSCTIALTAEAAMHPRRLLCLKTSADRIVVTAEYLAMTMTAGEEIGSLVHVEDDWVREVFVLVRARLGPPNRWWSLTLAEEEPRARRPGARLVTERR